MEEEPRPALNGKIPENTSLPSTTQNEVFHVEPCSGCGQLKQEDEFSKFHAKMANYRGSEKLEFLCNYCFQYGPPLKDPLADLDVKQRQAMLILASGGTMAAAARRMDISREKLRDILKGREQGIFRDAFLRLLVAGGLGPDPIIAALKRALKGKKMHFNSANGIFEEFDDYNAQMRAAGMLVKLFGFEQPTEMIHTPDTGSGGIEVHIHTNIGDGAEPIREEYEVEGLIVGDD